MNNWILLLAFVVIFMILNSQRNISNLMNLYRKGCPRHGMYRDYQPDYPHSLISPCEPYYEYDHEEF